MEFYTMPNGQPRLFTALASSAICLVMAGCVTKAQPATPAEKITIIEHPIVVTADQQARLVASGFTIVEIEKAMDFAAWTQAKDRAALQTLEAQQSSGELVKTGQRTGPAPPRQISDESWTAIIKRLKQLEPQQGELQQMQFVQIPDSPVYESLDQACQRIRGCIRVISTSGSANSGSSYLGALGFSAKVAVLNDGVDHLLLATEEIDDERTSTTIVDTAADGSQSKTTFNHGGYVYYRRVGQNVILFVPRIASDDDLGLLGYDIHYLGPGAATLADAVSTSQAPDDTSASRQANELVLQMNRAAELSNYALYSKDRERLTQLSRQLDGAGPVSISLPQGEAQISLEKAQQIGEAWKAQLSARHLLQISPLAKGITLQPMRSPASIESTASVFVVKIN